MGDSVSADAFDSARRLVVPDGAKLRPVLSPYLQAQLLNPPNHDRCPPDVQRRGVEDIAKSFAEGGSIRHRLSGTVGLPYKGRDGLRIDPFLNAYGIHHLHIGDTDTIHKGRSHRSPLVLYLMVDASNAYLLAIEEHLFSASEQYRSTGVPVPSFKIVGLLRTAHEMSPQLVPKIANIVGTQRNPPPPEPCGGYYTDDELITLTGCGSSLIFMIDDVNRTFILSRISSSKNSDDAARASRSRRP